MKSKLGLTAIVLTALVTVSGWAQTAPAPVIATTPNFVIAPYLFSTGSNQVHVGWQYDGGSSLNTPTVSILVDQGQGTTPVSVAARNSSGVWIADLPIASCGYGITRYQVPGMTDFQSVTAIPCPGSKSTVRLAFMADAQEFPDNVQILAKQISEQSVTAILNDGDLVQTGDDANAWSDFFAATNAYNPSTVTLPAIGNHEYRSTPATNLWGNFFQLPAPQAHYSTFVGDAHIIVLNSNFTDDPSQIDGQLNWLQIELAVPAQWTIVMFHHAVYCKGFFNSPLSPLKEYEYLQQQYVPLFEAAHVDLVLNGHDHIYERSLKNNVTYLVAGPAGGVMSFYATTNPYSQFSSLDRTITYFDVSEHQLSARSLNLDGTQIDSFTLSK